MTLNTLMLILALPFSSLNGQNDKEKDSSEIQIQKGHSLMEIVFDRFHINYEMSRTHKIGYYKETMSDSISPYYQAEGIVDIYIPSNLNQVENAFVSPIKARKTVFKEVVYENLLFGNASDMARSSIWRPHSFLGEKNRADYTFTYASDSQLESEDLIVIDFKPKKDNGFAVGKIFVDKASYAIVKVEYSPIVRKSKVWERVSWTEEFQYKNGAYELSNVSFSGQSIENITYEAMLIMDQLEVVSRIPQTEVFIKEDVSLFEKAEEVSSENFWEGFDFLKQKLKPEELFIASK